MLFLLLQMSFFIKGFGNIFDMQGIKRQLVQRVWQNDMESMTTDQLINPQTVYPNFHLYSAWDCIPFIFSIKGFDISDK